MEQTAQPASPTIWCVEVKSDRGTSREIHFFHDADALNAFVAFHRSWHSDVTVREVKSMGIDELRQMNQGEEMWTRYTEAKTRVESTERALLAQLKAKYEGDQDGIDTL